ncbi:NAD+ synthase [Sphingomicrobium astaxanthinifaciens]|uniref:NAD+ synthase n=1 Tax=Sphingomicrobium astaxanthinifaciens TaxID=1227949 RepID=UPI001FCB74EB|nr:NAD+ synthase [Sphingomicrobium astaxanthinifaciens]MCJ7421146.1 NAD+ synthase [Sphingomicrobium astaxanthinifaciens]
MKFRLALCQMNQRVGDLAGNVAAMLEWRQRAAAAGADLVLFPEMQVTGYPTEDLVLKPAFVRRAMEANEDVADATADGGPAIVFGGIHHHDGALYNAVFLAEKGGISAWRAKHELPNYGTFDERRVFEPGPLPAPVTWNGIKLGLPICEDIWLERVCHHLSDEGAELLLVINGSPYEFDKDETRQKMVRERVTESGVPLAYLNRVGGQDELAFDGSSFIVNTGGGIPVQLPDWDETLVLTDWEKGADGWTCAEGVKTPLDPYPEDVYHAMMVGLAEYVDGNGFPGVILGLSGGIDSALSAAIAVDALGPERVWCVMLPSDYTSSDSLEDAKACAELLGCRYDIIPIKPATEALHAMLGPSFEGRAPDTTEENLQSRLRMVTLMALSNKFGPMLLTTGNKSEMSVGYATLYGDMAGGYNVLKDAYKSTCFALSRWRNRHKPRRAKGPDGPVMPMNVITKPPTAELRHDQKDEDSLPPYKLLDRILEALIEEEQSVAATARQTGADAALVAEIEKLVLRAEYKRRQAPIGVKIGRRNFGRDRRYPITNAFRTGTP